MTLGRLARGWLQSFEQQGRVWNGEDSRLACSLGRAGGTGGCWQNGLGEQDPSECCTVRHRGAGFAVLGLYLTGISGGQGGHHRSEEGASRGLATGEARGRAVVDHVERGHLWSRPAGYGEGRSWPDHRQGAAMVMTVEEGPQYVMSARGARSYDRGSVERTCIVREVVMRES